MVELAVGGRRALRVSRDRSSTGRARPTRRTRSRRFARSAPDDELFLILGGDQAAALPSWHEPERVLELATVAVVERSGLVAQRDRDQDRAAAAAPSGSATSTCPCIADLLERDPPPGGRGQADPLPRARRGGELHRERRAVRRPRTGRPRRRPRRRCRPDLRAAATPPSWPSGSLRSPSDRKAIDVRVIDLRGIVSLHRLLRDLLGQHGAPDEGDPRRDLRGAEARERAPAAAPHRGRPRGPLDPARLPGRGGRTSSRPTRASTTAWSSSGARRRRAPWADSVRDRGEHVFVAALDLDDYNLRCLGL